MGKVWTIAANAWEETLRRKVFYLVLLATVLVAIIIGSQMALMRMAGAAGETGTVERMHASFVQTSLAVWNFAAIFLAVFLGAVGFSSEVSRKTIVHVLS